MPTFYLDLSVTVAMQAIAAVALGILIGPAGIFSAAQAVFYGVGAYIAALIALHVTTNLLVASVAGVLGAGVVGLIMAIPAVRVKGDYFVVASLAFSILMTTVFSQWTSVTGGYTGLIGVPLATLGSVVLQGSLPYLICGLVFLVLTVAVAHVVLGRAPLGRMVRAVRDDELAAVALGKSPVVVRIWAVLISSAIAGLAGVVFAFYVDYVNPSGFGTSGSILLITMVILGGTGRIWAPVLGAIVLGFGMPSLALLPISASVSGPVEQIVEGIALVLVMVYLPDGLIRVVDMLRPQDPVKRKAIVAPAEATSGTELLEMGS